jgi:uncharacterized repeat protein (TIGR01451 family)
MGRKSGFRRNGRAAGKFFSQSVIGMVFLFLLPLFPGGAVHAAAAPDPVFSSLDVLPSEDIGYGELQTYSFGVINNGSAPAQGVTVTVTVPVDGSGNYMEIVSVSTGYTQNNEVLTCTLGDLAAGATASLSVVVRATLAPGTPALGVMGELSYSGSGVVSDISQDIAIHPALSQTDLSLSMTAAPNPVNVNEEVTFRLTVTNLGGATGPALARGATVSNVTLVTHLPTGLTFVRASSGCSSSAGVVTCNLGSLADSATATVTIVARAPAAAASSLVTQADVSGNLPDPAPGNNTARVSISVVTGSASAVPTLSEWGTIFLGLILAGAAIGMIRRREAV